MITVIYIFKDREIERVQKSLDSLQAQTNTNFKVVFLDYGSKQPLQLSKYTNVEYVYLEVQNQPWNKSKAINHALKYYVKTPFCFVADIDMIFQNNFIETALKLTQTHSNFYFQVAYLKPKWVDATNVFNPSNYSKISNKEATGMTVFKTDILKDIQGFDEFFHFWGAEDTDVHNRIKNAGHQVYFYDKEVLMAHQWHPSYINQENKELTQKLQLTNIIQINHLHLKHNLNNKVTKVNNDCWGEIYFNNQLALNNQIKVYTYEFDVLYYLNKVIPNLKSGQQLNLIFTLPKEVGTTKYKLKKVLGKKIYPHFSLKKVNDMILLQIVTNWHNHTYKYVISDSLKEINFIIKKN